MLSELQVERRLICRTVGVEDTIRCRVAVVKAKGQGRASDESLVVSEVVDVRVLTQLGTTRKKRIQFLGRLTLQLNRSRQVRIHIFWRGAAAIGGQSKSARACASTACGNTGAPRASATGHSRAGAAERPGDQSAIHTKKECAGVSSQNVGVCNVQVEALDCDVVVVLKRQQNGIAQTQVNLATLHQVVETR